MLVVSFPLSYHPLMISLLAATRADLTARCDGSHFWQGVTGGFLTISSLFPCNFFTGGQTIKKREQDVRGAVLGVAGCLCTISLPMAYHFLTISLPSATRADLTAKCEGSHFGFAGVCIPFPRQLLTMSVRFPHQLLHAQN